ncbi:hypothetical protein EDD18DRAFT_1362808 [Armillaria luteobubalina]|uniref:Uncharacterized protein n=1 Tax=Armillaria luteobubalina TaxID=153913 RepID=A0AA39PD10_9AGAR|nr:hypothetical protein EDD18DRAFT_1362808 [Armillaria luteobubalina]
MPRPPIGAQREVYMRANYRYGIDDHVQWPQAYIEQYPHFACIHRVAPEEGKALCPLFHGLTHYNFMECDDTAIVKGVGHLRHLTFLRLQSACQGVIDSVGSISGSSTMLGGLQSHVSIIELLLGCLHALPTSFTCVCLTVAETQCVAHELHTFVEYMTIYKPLMEAPESDAPSMPVDDTLVGAFSNDATIIQRFFKAGIPVWRIVAMKDLPGVHIDKLSDFTMPPFVDEPCPLRLPSVFVGSSSDPQKYRKIQDFTMHSTHWVDPFALSTLIIMGREDVPVAMSMTSSSRYSPYQKKASGSQAKGTSHQLTDPKHPFLPPLVEPWRLGLLAVVADLSHCHSSAWPEASNPTAIPHENQYTFPCPDIIATLNMEEKVKSYLVSWLHLRAPLFACLTVTEQVPVNLYHQEWRTVLAMGFLHSAGETSGWAAKRREEVQKMMTFWRGKTYESLTSEEQQEVCWELGEVNFRCEFRALHCQATASSHPQDVSQCFPDGHHLPGQIDVGCANYGVAHHLWLQCAPYIFAMKKMMRAWNGPHPALLDKVQTMGWTENDFLELEKTVAAHYADSFYLYFGHAPVLPHQLSHCSSEDYVPEVWAHMSTSRSGVYMDIEELI